MISKKIQDGAFTHTLTGLAINLAKDPDTVLKGAFWVSTQKRRRVQVEAVY